MIQVCQINKKYGKKVVLSNINFEIKVGESLAVVGRNGTGKSTLIKIMAGIIKPSSGTLSYFGNSILENKKLFRKYCAYVPQDNALIEELSVIDNLKLWSGGKRHLDQDFIDRFELTEILSVKVSNLSGGMKRRVSIVCAISHLPPVLLLDEPTTALDIFYKDEIHKILKEYKKDKGIVIYTTHDEREIIESDRTLLLKDGILKELNHKEKRIESLRNLMISD
ncbi:MAG TPA: ATP-binding cassette domain-containing protein [Clostridiales bacterium]|nr:ATP-binding cassette domain-containing protein [Clostridiales bacterium]